MKLNEYEMLMSQAADKLVAAQDDNRRLKGALHSALEACRFYRDSADTRAWEAAQMWEQEARKEFEATP